MHVILTEKPAQKGHEWRTLGEVVRASAAKLTARIRLPRTICETPRASMIRVRVRYSLSRDRLRDSDAGLKEPGAPTAAPRDSACMVTERCDRRGEGELEGLWGGGKDVQNRGAAGCFGTSSPR